MTKVAPMDSAVNPPAGSPGWWASRPVPSTQPLRGRPRRSFDQIVEAALELVDEVGTDAFHMRLLAERLSTSPATLYRHVAGKAELMVYVVDRVLADVRADDDATRARHWQDAARATALRLHRALTDHPNVIPLLAAQIPVGPNAMASREETLAAFASFNLSPRLAARAYTTIAQFVIGFAVLQPASPGEADAAALANHYRHLDPDVYPYTAAAADTLTSTPIEAELHEGLKIILDGIDRARRGA